MSIPNAWQGLNFGLGEDLDMLRDTVGGFSRDRIAPRADEIDRSNTFPRDLWPEMGALGLLGITVEEEYGGSAQGYLSHCIAMEEVSRASASVGLSYGAHSNLCVNQLRRNGNAAQKRKLFSLVSRHFEGRLAGRTIAVWGLAFKPNTDDMREAPSRTLLEELWGAGARVHAYDPEAASEAERIYGRREDFVLGDDPYAALDNADALVVVTEWKAFRSPDLERIRASLKEPVIFDGRNIFEPKAIEAAGIAYYGIGRGRSVIAI